MRRRMDERRGRESSFRATIVAEGLAAKQIRQKCLCISQSRSCLRLWVVRESVSEAGRPITTVVSVGQFVDCRGSVSTLHLPTEPSDL